MVKCIKTRVKHYFNQIYRNNKTIIDQNSDKSISFEY